jgi:hypothetical protein
MRRWVAVVLLCLVALYLGATGEDACGDGPGEACAPICHLLCSDGCATAPVPETPAAPPCDPPPAPCFLAERIPAFVSLSPEPEKDPPRA